MYEFSKWIKYWNQILFWSTFWFYDNDWIYATRMSTISSNRRYHGFHRIFIIFYRSPKLLQNWIWVRTWSPSSVSGFLVSRFPLSLPPAFPDLPSLLLAPALGQKSPRTPPPRRDKYLESIYQRTTSFRICKDIKSIIKD